jgi:hypothetical protein
MRVNTSIMIRSPGFILHHIRNHFIGFRIGQMSGYSCSDTFFPNHARVGLYRTFISRKSPKSLWLVENSSDQP